MRLPCPASGRPHSPLYRLRLLLQRIPVGFPSPADEYAESALDLNTYLVRNKTATFFFRVIGDSIIGAHIHDGDLLVVDRYIEPRHGHVVLAIINNEYNIKRLHRLNGVIELHAENPAYPPMSFQEHDELMNAVNRMKPQVVSQARCVRGLLMLVNHSIREKPGRAIRTGYGDED
jgi:DNA polymerase V